jgi:tRNA dimethylallyltransferase
LAGERVPLLVLLGPTAVGKSALALSWARRVGAEIIAADSTTVYRGLDIGTAKPSRAEQGLVPHHLVDIVEPTEQYSAARFQQDAEAAIADIRRRGRLPLMVGGTGLFIRSVVRSYPFLPPVDPVLRTRLLERAERDGLPALRRQLGLVDPASFAAIAPGDVRRTVRALEAYLGTGRRLPRSTGAITPYRALVVGLTRPREELRERIRIRARAQLDAGLLSEILDLLKRGVPWNAPGFRALGYREGIQWARGRLHDAEVWPLMVRHTAQYAKRQMTWFRREPDVRWIDLGSVTEDQALERVVDWTRDLLTAEHLRPDFRTDG